jgi:hypothetical protein
MIDRKARAKATATAKQKQILRCAQDDKSLSMTGLGGGANERRFEGVIGVTDILEG